MKLIYMLFPTGLSSQSIAKMLMEKGIESPAGKEKWYPGMVQNILTNEKVKGDALLQKKFTVDFLSKKQKKNEGEIPQHYVTGNPEFAGRVADALRYVAKRVSENACIAHNQAEYQTRYNELVSRYDDIKGRHTAKEKAISERQVKAERLEAFAEALESQ